MTNLFKILNASLFVLLLNGCGSSNNLNEETQKNEETQENGKKYAYLIDSAVEGVDFVTSLKGAGETDSEGKLEFNSNAQTISFSVGGIKLLDFNLSKLNKDRKIYITDLVGVDRNDTSNENVLKILRILQTLDDDDNASNGIRITQNIKNTLDANINIVDTNITTLSTMIKTKTSKDLISSSKAKEHFEDTLTKNLGYKFTRGLNWKGLTYNTVTSPHAYSSEITANGKIYPTGTKRIWLDRNLGASQICTAYNDSNCYGDYYQWGRNTDGHEKSDSNISNTQASDVSNVGHGNFIKDSTDWTRADNTGNIRIGNWSKIDGTSICPKGFRVPTKVELEADTIGLTGADEIKNGNDAFNNFLKLPSPGYRANFGSLVIQGFVGSFWTTSVSGSSSQNVEFSDGNKGSYSLYRVRGLPVRCIKH